MLINSNLHLANKRIPHCFAVIILIKNIYYVKETIGQMTKIYTLTLTLSKILTCQEVIF